MKFTMILPFLLSATSPAWASESPFHVYNGKWKVTSGNCSDKDNSDQKIETPTFITIYDNRLVKSYSSKADTNVNMIEERDIDDGGGRESSFSSTEDSASFQSNSWAGNSFGGYQVTVTKMNSSKEIHFSELSAYSQIIRNSEVQCELVLNQ